jgi:hypothetical protein
MDRVDFLGDLSLTALGILAMLALWTGALGSRIACIQRATCAVAAMGWSILVGRWLYVAWHNGDWITAAWPSQAGLIMIAVGSISFGRLTVLENLRRERVAAFAEMEI